MPSFSLNQLAADVAAPTTASLRAASLPVMPPISPSMMKLPKLRNCSGTWMPSAPSAAVMAFHSTPKGEKLSKAVIHAPTPPSRTLRTLSTKARMAPPTVLVMPFQALSAALVMPVHTPDRKVDRSCHSSLPPAAMFSQLRQSM